jgi:hypothetical protein
MSEVITLAAPVDLFIAATNRTDGNTVGPDWVRLRIDQAFLSKLLRCRDFCIEEEQDRTDSAREPTAVSTSQSTDEIAVEHWAFAVSPSCFWFEAWGEGDIIADSNLVSLPNLLRWLHGVPTDAAPADGMRWYGGCLFACDDNEGDLSEKVDELLESVLASCPEVAAQQHAIELTEHMGKLRDAGSKEKPADASAPRRRRIGV